MPDSDNSVPEPLPIRGQIEKGTNLINQLTSLRKKINTPELRFTVSTWASGILILSLILISIFLNREVLSNKEKRSEEKFFNRNYNTQNTFPAATLQPQITYPPRIINFYSIVRQIDGEERVLYEFSQSVDPKVDLWKDNLITGKYEYAHPVDVYIYNFATNEEKLLFHLEQSDPKAVGDLTQIKVIGDKLFVSIGGYLVIGATYMIDLNTGEQVKIGDTRNANIVNFKNYFWLLEGEGDACWGFTKFWLLDPLTGKLTFIAQSNVGCQPGEQYIGIDNRERMLLANHTAFGSGYGNSSKNPDEMFTYIIAIPISNPKIKEGIIAVEEMPSDIKDVSFLQATDQILLLGQNKNYIYDLATRKFEEISNIPEYDDSKYSFMSEKSSSPEEMFEGLDLPNDFKLVKKEVTE